MKFNHRGFFKALLLVSVLSGGVGQIDGCAHARHLAVVADATFANAVFALDDAETKACQSHAMSAADCAKADPKIVKALLDVQAVTTALQNTPKNVAAPKNLPDLLTDLTEAQGIIAPAAAAPDAPQPVKDLGSALTNAIVKTIAIVKTFTGGQ